MNGKLDKLVSNMSSMMKIYDGVIRCDKKEKSSNSVIVPESWFQHFTELFRKKNLNITLFLNIHIYPYTYQLKHSNL